MTFPAIQADGGVSMAALAEMFVATSHAIILGAGMTTNAFLQTVLLITDAFVHGLVALVQQQLHVVSTHKIFVFNAMITRPGLIDDDRRADFRRCAGRCIGNA